MKFLTFLNSGCIDICKNMLKSAEIVGLDLDDFIIACLDTNAYEEMKNYSGSFLYMEQDLTEYQDWSFNEDSSFRKIVRNKWELIKKVYTEHKELCWVDTDIVFLKNPLSLIENKDKILFQRDSPGSVICSGFMVFNSTDRCSALIDECGNNIDEDDQILVNEIALTKYQDIVELLNPRSFPNGYTYYNLGVKEYAYIVHNNWMTGVDIKIEKFKEEKLWFL